MGDKRFFLDNDQDGRWFIVPSDKREAWIDWQQDDLADPDEPPAGCRRIYGSPSSVVFADPDGPLMPTQTGDVDISGGR